jgi:hypothetical protein
LLLSVTAKLKDDDRALAKAETLASGLESTEEDHILKNRAAELTSALSKFVSEEIYCRLDRLYLETLEAGHYLSGEAVETNDSIVVLEEDLESLYSEVEVLAEMSARQQFGEQILRELQRNHDRLNSILQGNLNLVCSLSLFSNREEITDSGQDFTFDHGDDGFCGTHHRAASLSSVMPRVFRGVVSCLLE